MRATPIWPQSVVSGGAISPVFSPPRPPPGSNLRPIQNNPPESRRPKMESGEVETVSVGEFLCYEFDFIVVGGGTAGLAVASRLAEGGRFAVGVIEAGCHARNEETIDIPAYYGRSLGGQYDWKFETVPQPGLGGRALPWPRGKVLGGTSALNFMTWNRPSRDDYDAWEALGNVGWGWESML